MHADVFRKDDFSIAQQPHTVNGGIVKHFRSDAGHVRIVAAEGKVERAVGIEARDGPSAGKVDFAVRRHLHVVQSIVDEIGLADDILSGLLKS